MKKEDFDIWRSGARAGIPVMLGYLAVSFAFGVAAQKILTPVQATVMAATNYSSTGQLSALLLIQSNAPYFELAIAQIVINLRYALMSCSLSQKLERATPLYQRALLASGITDEIFALSASVPGKLNPKYSYGVMSTAMPGWVLGTLLGAVSGSILPPRLLNALGISLYGMFIAIVVPKCKGDRVLTLIVVFSMAMNFFAAKMPYLSQLSSGSRIVVLTVAIAGAAAFLFPIKPQATDKTVGNADSIC